MTGMTDASATRRPRTPCTRRDVSTTAFPAAGSAPIVQLPTFALPLCTVSRMYASIASSEDACAGVFLKRGC